MAKANTIRDGLAIQKAVILALFLRELRTRFGKYRLGYLWALLEPAAHVLVLLAVFGLLMGRAMPDISFPVFFIGGVVPWFLFSNIATRSLKAVEANLGLFNYAPVKPIDTILARALLEVVIYGAVYAVLLLLVWLLGEPLHIGNLPVLLAAFLGLGWFALGLGLIFMALGDAFTEADRIIPIAIKPLYFVSGVFFSIHNIPADFRAWLYWNPILHAIELGRNALFPTYAVQEASLAYLLACALAANVLGLLVYRLREKEMLSS